MNNKTVVINGKNTYIIDGDTTWILLTQNKMTIIDTEDIPLVWPYRWYARLNRRVWYAYSSVWHRGPKFLMHRVLLDPPKGLAVDHRDHNGLNNRRHNIRPCTTAQNNQNRPPGDRKGYKGVWPDKRYTPWTWRAEINIDRKKVCLGTFKTRIEAMKAYNEAAKKYHGEFAWLNVIPV